MLEACPDERVARVDEIWMVADSITPMVAFYDLPLEKLMTYKQRIAEALFV